MIITDSISLESALTAIEQSLIMSFKKSCPISRTKNNKTQTWWNKDLQRLRKESRKAFNEASRGGTDELWKNYRDKLRCYKKEIRKSKREDYINIIEQLREVKDTSRFRKLLSKKEQTIGNLRAEGNIWTENEEETLKLLFETHFPGCKWTLQDNKPLENTQIIPGAEIKNLITLESVKWAAYTFGPYKSPGLDGIYPKMIQEALDIMGDKLVEIYMYCVENTYIPKSWRNVRVVFIPKAGKIQHNTPKDFRPISLSSFIMKTLERIMDEFIRRSLDQSALSSNQHAYIKGKSVDTALHSVVYHIEKSLNFKEFTLGAFLDIEGAFNNVEPGAIQRALYLMGVESLTINWLMAMLSQRIISAELGNGALKAVATRGTPQGGVISPLLWILVVNEVLVKLENLGVKVVAYADDVVLLASGKFINTVSDVLENALKVLSTWAKSCGLKVNPIKTELVLFTNRRKIPTFELPKLNGITLSLSQSATFLGVTLDRKLDWRANLDIRIRKSLCAIYMCQKLIRGKWGLRPKLFHWLYTAVIRPIASYGCHVWWPIMNVEEHSKKIAKINRIALLSMSGAMSSTATSALEVILDVMPLDIYIRQTAKITLNRLQQIGALHRNSVRHMELVENSETNICSDLIVPQNVIGSKFNVVIPSIEDWDRNRVKQEDISLFTDGSKLSTGTGSGFYCEKLKLNESFRLRDDCSIFQAEIYAITKAVKKVSMLPLYKSDIGFYIDSQAALMALSSNIIRSRVVMCCLRELNVLCEHHNITLYWVPGHKGITGNEEADVLAKEGANLALEMADQEVYPPLSLRVHRIKQTSKDEWYSRWDRSDKGKQTKLLWNQHISRNNNILLDMDRRQLRMVINLTTGHNTLGKHMVKLGISNDDTCRWCKDAIEDSYHFLCRCPALTFRRFSIFNCYYFQALSDLNGVNPWKLLAFIETSRWKA